MTEVLRIDEDPKHLDWIREVRKIRQRRAKENEKKDNN